MKESIVLFSLFFASVFYLSAQDIIVFRSGEEVSATVKKVGVTTIEYVKYNNPAGPTYEVLKSDVVQILYKNGTKDIFSKVQKQIGPASQTKPGTFTDERDGETYTWVKIGEQIWMGENLRFDNGTSPCSENDDPNCNNCGRYYTFEEAVKACPKGWHLPSDQEWMDLEVNVGMNEADAGEKGWRGTHPGQAPKLLRGGDTGLDLRMCGYVDESNYVVDQYKQSYYWTSTKIVNINGYTQGGTSYMRHFKARASIDRSIMNKEYNLTIRCVKNQANK